MGDPPPAPRRPLFDLNVAVEEFEDEFEEEPQEMEQVVEVREVVEEEEEEVEEEEPQEMIMEEDEEAEAAAAAAEAAQEEEDAIVEKEVVEEAGMMAEAGEDEGRRKKRKEYEVFVFGLPPEAVEEDVAAALAEAGEVEQVRLVRDPAEPQLNKGFAFVRFAEVWQARWAANDLRTAKRVLHQLRDPCAVLERDGGFPVSSRQLPCSNIVLTMMVQAFGSLQSSHIYRGCCEYGIELLPMSISQATKLVAAGM